MAITKITAPSSIPATVADYQAQNSHLMAFINQINSQAFILSDPNGTVAPTIKQGAYISHGGSLYIVEDADATISGSPSDGTVYIRVSGTDTLTAEYVTDISSYAWNSAYNAMISGSYTLLPYMLVKSGTSWARYNFNPNNQQFDNARIGALEVTGNTTVGGTLGVTGAISGATVNTGQGATEVYLMNQNLRTTDIPTFANLEVTGAILGASIDVLGEISGSECITINGPNKPVDNSFDVMPEVGIGGFTYASATYPTENSHAKIWIPNTGIFIVHIEFDAKANASTSPSTPVLQFTTRQSSGYSVEITQDAPAGSQLRAWAMRLA